MNPELSYTSQPINAQPNPAPRNLFSRVIGIWFSPSETFAEIGRAPRVLIPLLLVIILSIVSIHFLNERYGRERLIREQIEAVANSGMLPQDKVDEIIQQSVTPAAINRGKYTEALGTALWMVVALLIIAGLVKAYSLMMGAQNTFKQLLSVTVYAFLAIGLISTLVLIISIYLKDPSEINILNPVSSNLGSVLTMLGIERPKFVVALASFVDLFGIWRLILLSIGYAAVSHKLKTSTVAIFLVGLYIVLALVGSALASIFYAR